MFHKMLYVRYILLVAVVFLLLSACAFIIVGSIHCLHGFVELARHDFLPTEEARPGLHLLEGLDAYMVALIFMIFGLGIARLFVFDKANVEGLPAWLNIHDIKELKVLLWETILVTLVILCVTNLAKHPVRSWEVLLFPGVILILSLALYFVRGKESH